jgi:hypothetical protein
MRGSLEIDPIESGFADPRWGRELFQQAIGDEALIDATQDIHKALQDVLGFQRDPGKLLQRAPTLQRLGIVHDHLDAKRALAFGVDLRSQLAAEKYLGFTVAAVPG